MNVKQITPQQAYEILQNDKSVVYLDVRTQGEFQKGDVVALCDAEGHVIARGLTNYSSADVERIKGLKSEKIAQVLGRCPYEEVIHRDNLAIVKK